MALHISNIAQTYETLRVPIHKDSYSLLIFMFRLEGKWNKNDFKTGYLYFTYNGYILNIKCVQLKFQ